MRPVHTEISFTPHLDPGKEKQVQVEVNTKCKVNNVLSMLCATVYHQVPNEPGKKHIAKRGSLVLEQFYSFYG